MNIYQFQSTASTINQAQRQAGSTKFRNRNNKNIVPFFVFMHLVTFFNMRKTTTDRW
ncbi:hypothetical protein K457DRAFT_278808 [Linnemannia elongata AG-77]|uniref:Uncharacterized protein n=1 Tax=Linnemannia elongata AG-77 TaxID=1314771 RepID=A0A197K8E2_9FUNG|nr:hypothetical protein K457DRAFT_278808 [Linnemannia elongata AG-77]